MVGSRIDCPKCHSKVLVPGIASSASSSSEQDEWFSLEPIEAKKPSAVPVPSPSPAGDQGDPPRSLFDDDLPDLVPLTQAPPVAPSTRGERALREALDAGDGRGDNGLAGDDLFDDPAAIAAKPAKASGPVKASVPTIASGPAGQAATPTSPKPAPAKSNTNQEYSVSCKVCKTLLTVRSSQAGSQIKCPDCHSMLVIPPPPVKKPAVEIKISELEASVPLSPLEGNNPRVITGASVNTKEILSKASRELEREKQEIDSARGAFDSKEWLSRTFGFLSDLRLVATLFILGLVFALVYYIQASISFSSETELSNFVLRFREDLLYTLTFPLQLVLFICAVAVIPKSANRQKKIEPWPFFQSFKEYIAPACVGFVVFLLINFVSTLLAGVLAFVKMPILLQDAFADALAWGCLPIVYLSMLESQSHTKPFSKGIYNSISAKTDAWGAMYMQTGIAWVMYFVFWQMGLVNGPAMSAFAGFVFPWFICFLANQYGVLAGQISDITDLGYEGVFTESE
jgi:DNA-directed RNA polymerase subunit RPC12/RpoP